MSSRAKVSPPRPTSGTASTASRSTLRRTRASKIRVATVVYAYALERSGFRCMLVGWSYPSECRHQEPRATRQNDFCAPKLNVVDFRFTLVSSTIHVLMTNEPTSSSTAAISLAGGDAAASTTAQQAPALPHLDTPNAFPFPYPQPYSIQLDLMRTVFAAIEDGKIAIVRQLCLRVSDTPPRSRAQQELANRSPSSHRLFLGSPRTVNGSTLQRPPTSTRGLSPRTQTTRHGLLRRP